MKTYAIAIADIVDDLNVIEIIRDHNWQAALLQHFMCPWDGSKNAQEIGSAYSMPDSIQKVKIAASDFNCAIDILELSISGHKIK